MLALLGGTQLAEAATVDPKRVELSRYHGLPHLLRPVVLDVEQVVSGLKDVLDEMERRYRLFARLGVRNLDGYCKVRLQKRESGDPSLTDMAAIVIIIDELAELMREVPREGEEFICRLAQLGRAAGMHLVLATQRPSVEVVTGRLKANIPTRIACMVSCAADSRSILERGGAERLLGGGDMLYLPADAEQPERIQGAFVAEEEVSQLVN